MKNLIKYASLFIGMVLPLTMAYSASSVTVNYSCKITDVLHITTFILGNTEQSNTCFEEHIKSINTTPSQWAVNLSKPECKHYLRGAMFLENTCEIPAGEGNQTINVTDGKYGCVCQ